MMEPTNSPDRNVYLNDRRLRIREVLSQRDNELGTLYWTAIEILDPSTPERRRMSAHAIREMTNALPAVIDVPTKASKGNLRDYVERVISPWKKAKDGTCFVNGKWKGTIDQVLEKALNVVDELIAWHEENRPQRSAVAKGFFRKSDPSPVPV